MKLSLVRRKLEKVDRSIEKAIDRGELPGAVVLAQQGEELRYEGVFGAAVISPQRRDAQRDTIYDLASLTKVMATTAAAMRLVGESKLQLDQPVSDIIGGFADHGKGEISVRNLLTHSSGLRPWCAYFADLREKELRRGGELLGTPVGRKAIIQRILRSALVHDPGEASVYGDLGFIVLGAVIEQLTGETLDTYCSRNIFEPLGLRDTRFHPIPFEGDRLRLAATEQCEWREKVVWGEVHDGNAWAMGGVAGHAGLFGTADDVMRFGLEMLAASRGESPLFGQDLANEFFRRQKLSPDCDWALGWDTPTPGASTSGQYFSEHAIGHTGFTGTSLWVDLDSSLVIVMLSNRVHLLAKKSKFTLRPLVHDAIVEAFRAA